MRVTIAAALALGITAAPAAAQTGTATFDVGSVAIELPLPQGYCEPTGAGVKTAEFVARADSDNVTDLTLFPCGGDGSADDYYLVKTPRSVLDMPMQRPALLASLKAEFDKPGFAAALRDAEVTGKASEAYSRLTGGKAEVTGAVNPLGLDETCAYLGGVLAFESAAVKYKRAVSGCITAVGDRVVMVYRYSAGEQANVLGMLRQAKALALAMRAKP